MEKQSNTPSLFLDDHLVKEDFGKSLITLAGDLAIKAQLPAKPDEVGLVCSNVLLAAEYLEKTYKGMNFFFLGSGSPKMFKEKGNSTPFTTRLGFGMYQGIILELAEPGIGSEVFSQTEIVEDKIMINHLGFEARDAALTRVVNGKTISYLEIMNNLGIPKTVEAELDVLGVIGHVHIFETMHIAHQVEIEFIDFRFWSLTGPKINYPSGLINLLAWWQEKIGPRFKKMKADSPLAPAPV